MKIGLYIHIPFCNAKCCYCDFASFVFDLNIQKKYVAAIKNEIAFKCADYYKKTGKKYIVETVFIGGGTPSCLYHDGLSEIIYQIKKHTVFNPTEFTVEANPETVSHDFVLQCKDIGANRMSLGLQTCSDILLKNLRRHTYSDFLNAVSLIKKEGITNINADIMLGLPNQTKQDLQKTLDNLLGLNLEHISAYGLKVEKNTPLYKSGFRADEDFIADLYDITKDTLSKKYCHYEVSNFSIPGFECKHNQKYWTLKPYLGVGLSASSYLFKKRFTNTFNLHDYLAGSFDDFCEDSKDNYLKEYIMLGLRTKIGINEKVLIKNGFDITLSQDYKSFIKKGILLKNDDIITLNPNYYYIMNQIITKLILF